MCRLRDMPENHGRRTTTTKQERDRDRTKKKETDRPRKFKKLPVLLHQNLRKPFYSYDLYSGTPTSH